MSCDRDYSFGHDRYTRKYVRTRTRECRFLFKKTSKRAFLLSPALATPTLFASHSTLRIHIWHLAW